MKVCKRGHERQDKESHCRECKVIANSTRYYKLRMESGTLFKKQTKEEKAAKKKEYERKNKERRKEYIKTYSPELRAKQQKSYQSRHRKQLTANEKLKRQSDPVYKLKCNLRGRLTSILRGQYKNGSAVRDLGCTGEELKLYLESLFQPGMTWDNYGNKEDQWSIDHIIPLSRVDLTNREELLKVCHYTNLQPLWHIDNLKKSNKL